MRVFFMVCFMASAFAVTAPMVADTETVSAVSALRVEAAATARPVEIAIELTPSPALDPAAPDPTAAPAAGKAPPILKPKHAVAPVPPPPTPAPTPAQTPEPTSAPSAKPKATAKPTPKATPAPSANAAPRGTTYTRQQVIAGIKSAWGGDDDKAVAVADCESSLNPRAGGTYLGLWQFHIETWRNYGGTGDPRDHSPHVQTEVAWNVFQDYGWSAWPGCA